MVIYIIQDDGNKNFTPLLSMSNNIVILTNRDCPVIGDASDHLDKMRAKLKHFEPEKDALVLVGDPVNIGVAMHEVMMKGGATVLKWDRQTRNYLPIKLKEI